MHLFTVLAASALAFTQAPAQPASTRPAQPALIPVESGIIAYANAERQRYGLPPLAVDSWLLDSARRHAAWMANSGSLVHTRSPVAENIAMGQRSSAEAVRDWMNSPGHRANLLNRGYTRIGAAAYTGPSGQAFWCVQFLR